MLAQSFKNTLFCAWYSAVKLNKIEQNEINLIVSVTKDFPCCNHYECSTMLFTVELLKTKMKGKSFLRVLCFMYTSLLVGIVI